MSPAPNTQYLLADPSLGKHFQKVAVHVRKDHKGIVVKVGKSRHLKKGERGRLLTLQPWQLRDFHTDKWIEEPKHVRALAGHVFQVKQPPIPKHILKILLARKRKREN